MKKFLLLLTCLLWFTGIAAAQAAPRKAVPRKAAAAVSTGAVYRLGNRTVRIPAPDKFTDTMVDYPHIAQLFLATEAPTNDVLAVHVEDEILPQIKDGGTADLPFYTKVSVSKSLKTLDMEPQDFQDTVAAFEKQSPGLMAESGRLFQETNKNAQDGLNNLFGTDVGLQLSGPKLIGYFDKRANVFSALMTIVVEVRGRLTPVIGTLSMLSLNKRLVYLYVFRNATSDTDAEMLRNFTKAWTAKVIAANK